LRFQVVLKKTLCDLLGLKRVISLVALGLFLPFIMSLVWRSSMLNSPMSLQMEIHYVMDNFTIILFMWVSGLILSIAVATTGAGFISKEDSDGTLLIMVSKPIKKWELVLGKYLALVINAMMLQTVVLLLSLLIFQLVLPIDPETFDAILMMLPWALLYSLLVTLVFSSIATAFSAIWKSRIRITVVLMLIIMLVFFVGIIPRTMFAGAYQAYYLYLVDLGYHLGNSFTMIMGYGPTGQMMPQNQFLMSMFAGTYKGLAESYDPDIGALPPSLQLSNYVSPVVSTVIWAVVIVGALALAMCAVNRKEIH